MLIWLTLVLKSRSSELAQAYFNLGVRPVSFWLALNFECQRDIKKNKKRRCGWVERQEKKIKKRVEGQGKQPGKKGWYLTRNQTLRFGMFGQAQPTWFECFANPKLPVNPNIQHLSNGLDLDQKKTAFLYSLSSFYAPYSLPHVWFPRILHLHATSIPFLSSSSSSPPNKKKNKKIFMKSIQMQLFHMNGFEHYHLGIGRKSAVDGWVLFVFFQVLCSLKFGFILLPIYRYLFRLVHKHVFVYSFALKLLGVWKYVYGLCFAMLLANGVVVSS